MCGIVGYIGPQPCAEVLIEGLSRLEYRGYDSAGTAIFSGNHAEVCRSEGKLSKLAAILRDTRPQGNVGIGHTRWATHGRPSEQNAHPHKYGRVTVVHNGIIENHAALRRELIQVGHLFSSETDSEIVAHLIERALGTGQAPFDALRTALTRLRGAYALCVLVDGVTDCIFAARHDAPLIIGLGHGENFIASDVPAILSRTRDIIFLGDGDVAIVRAQDVALHNVDGHPIQRASEQVLWDPIQAEKGGHKHFMIKEIHDQSRAVIDTLRGRISPTEGDVFLDDSQLDFDRLQRLVIVGCGTSYHAALVGKFLIEGLAKIPVEVDLASEFRYRDPLVNAQSLVLGISQSGETADTLAALREAKRKQATTLAIVNVVGSSIAREANGVIYTHAGPEIGVASTKSFMTQLVTLLLLAIFLGRKRGALSASDGKALIADLLRIPDQINELLAHSAQIDPIARRYAGARDFLYLGRGLNYPIALEGALKLKETSYIHAEGYPAGEMKHGPIALIDDKIAVVVIAPLGPGYEKVVNNLTEVRSRQARVIAIATAGDTEIAGMVDDVFFVPPTRPELQPLLTVVPLQLLAYRIADLLGTDVDQPRNLAKSVTVE